jgi:hypothetical protein
MTMDTAELIDKVAGIMTLEDLKKRNNKLHSLVLHLYNKRPYISPTQKHYEYLMDLAIESLNQGQGGTFTNLVQIGAVLCEQPPSISLESVGQDEQFPYYLFRVPDIMASVLERAGVFMDGEAPLYHDGGNLIFKNKESMRTGILFLTNRRLICVGVYQGALTHDTTTYRVMYDDWENKPYLGALDYIFLKQVRSVKSDYGFTKKQVIMEYHTKYLKEKGYTIYGPLFFKFDRPKSAKMHEGSIDVSVQMSDPRKTRQLRQEELVRKVKQLSSLR